MKMSRDFSFAGLSLVFQPWSFHGLIFALPFLFVSVGASQQPSSPLVDSYESYKRIRASSPFDLQWISLGPVVNSARVESVQVDPTRPGTMYVAFGSGNLWKTINHGLSWRPIFENQPSYGIGDIALAPSNPNVLYVGTGESLKKARNFTIPGTGVYRSDDGGENWRHLGLSDSWHIGEIAVHPLNPDIALVAVLGHFWSRNSHRGIYRTQDGGKSWKQVLKIDSKTGANDVVWAADPNVVYASMWENFPGVSGAKSSIHKSEDEGKTWIRCEQGLPADEHVGRIGLAVSQSNAQKVYALIDNREDIAAGAAQVYKSIDGGKTWQRTHKTALKFFSRIGWYFADLYVNPQDDQEIFALGVRVAHSKDGGKTFDYLGGKVTHLTPSVASGLHLDHCEMWIHPDHPEHLVLGNDGGLYQSFDKGKSWLHFNNIPTGEFYDVEVDQVTPYRIFAGAQDNATVFGPSDEWIPGGKDQWKYLWIDPWNGGDGCVTVVDPVDSNTVYYSAQEGAFRRKNMVTNRSRGIRPRLPDGHPGELRFNFVAPMIISPHDSNQLFIGANYLFRSTNRGDQWALVSPDLTVSESGKQAHAISAIAESTRCSGLVYVGTDGGHLWVSEDSGKGWEDRSSGLPGGYIRSLVPSRHSDSHAFLAMSGLNQDDLQTYLFRTLDRGKTWESIASNLPSEPANVIIEDPVHPDLLYAGLFRGVYLSMDGGRKWSLLGRNLPACSVADLAFQETEKDLIVATHGRGIYKMNLSPVHQLITERIPSQNIDYLFPIPTARLPFTGDIRPGLNFSGVVKTPITFWVKKSGQVRLSVFKLADQSETPVKVLEVPARQGLNQIRWDLVVKKTESDAPYFVQYLSFLNAGQYKVQLETEGSPVQSRELIVAQPRQPSLSLPPHNEPGQ
jgi:photosystem II stability/assembly factor-like uncharacterized protein